MSKSNVFVDLLQSKDTYHCQELIIILLYMGYLFTGDRKQKKNPIFIFKSVRVRLRESVLLRECVSTESDWDCITGI